MNKKGNNILITGGAGFLGSHLCEKLLASHHKIICLDNFFTGNKNNINHLLDNPNFELIEHDITKPINLKVNQIYNLACPASPIHYQHDPYSSVSSKFLKHLDLYAPSY